MTRPHHFSLQKRCTGSKAYIQLHAALDAVPFSLLHPLGNCICTVLTRLQAMRPMPRIAAAVLLLLRTTAARRHRDGARRRRRARAVDADGPAVVCKCVVGYLFAFILSES